MLVRDVMVPVAGHIDPEMNLREASEHIKALDIDPMPVVENGKIVGLLSSEDLQTASEEGGLGTGGRKVRNTMTSDVHCVREDMEIPEAIRHIEQHSGRPQVARWPVTGGTGLLVGIVAIDDLQSHAHTADAGVAEVHDVQSVSEQVDFDEDRVDHMSDASFPASDPIPPPTTLTRGEDSPSDTDKHH